MEEDTRLRRRKDSVRPLYFLPLRVDVEARSSHPAATNAESTLTLTLAGLRPRDTVRTVKGACGRRRQPFAVRSEASAPARLMGRRAVGTALTVGDCTVGVAVVVTPANAQSSSNTSTASHTRTSRSTARCRLRYVREATPIHTPCRLSTALLRTVSAGI
jgi:hypothetical protein